jgi:hypothetical protein
MDAAPQHVNAAAQHSCGRFERARKSAARIESKTKVFRDKRPGAQLSCGNGEL